MLSQSDFIRIVRDELALPLVDTDLESDLDQVVDWDSLHVLQLVVALENETGRRVPVAQLLQARTLSGIYEQAAAA
ncbi:acyl carrier protein [Streptomyces sp. P6-2-1]|uniref:acyl carrier protein n=1 Tax=unclassified Streptomyces TaxID=2593676 RepID=UPI003D35EDEB